MNGPNDGSTNWLRESIDEKFHTCHELRDSKFDKVQLQFDFLDANLRLQAREYERRLSELNHAHTQALEAQSQTVPREVYNNFIRQHESNEKDNERRFISIELRLQEVVTRSLTWTAAIGIFITIINLVSHFWAFK